MVSVTHATPASGPNNPDKQISADAWNESHSMTGTEGTVLGFDATGNAVEVSATLTAATRALLAEISSAAVAVYLTESGREGTFAWSSSDLSAQVTADPGQGVYVAPATDTTGASGAWVRRFSGAYNVKWFGAVADDTTDAGSVFAAAIAYLKTTALTGSYGSGSAALYVPAGKYYLGTTTLDISHTLSIVGEGMGEAGGPCSQLRWAAATTGIRIQRYNTNGASGATGNGVGGDGSIIRGLYLKGAYTNIASEGEYHAIHLRARAFIRDCYIESFQGDGIFANCSSGSGGATEGNANNIRGENLFITLCRNGIWLQGSDVNAGSFSGIDVLGNRRWGIYDGTFLGNAYYAPHASSNGVYADITPTIVHKNGHYFTPIVGTTGHSTNSPPATAVDDARWYYVRDGAVDTTLSILEWTNGMAVRDGGPYYGAASVLFSNPYAESNQSFSQGDAKTLFVNFTNTSGIRGPFLEAAQGQVKVNELRVDDGGASPTLTASDGQMNLLGGLLYLDGPSTVAMVYLRSAAGATTNGSITGSSGGGGMTIDGSSNLYMSIGASTVGQWYSSGLTLASGKVLQVNLQTVVGARKTGWAVDTGTAKRTANATYSGTAEASYTQATIQTLMNAVRDLSQTVKALKDDLHSTAGHGLIGT